ncbi:MAG: hypothetical protein IH627_10950 [Rubrivivax sp.]|nr:hypothetical protein [Rubrivivax sp.]
MLTLLLLTACGGGGGGGDTGTVPTAPVSGGSTSSPTSLSVEAANTFGTDAFFNNFRYVASADERLVIRVNPATPLSDTQYARCASNPGYPSKVQVYDSRGVQVGVVCDEDVTFTFAAAGTYMLNFEFPDNGGGTFNAASLKGAAPVQFLETGDGSPTRPKKLSTLTGNAIDSNPFNDYYWVQAEQGETLVLAVQLQKPLTQAQKTRCGAGAESTNNAQLRVFDARLTQVAVACAESLRFVAPAVGTYVIRTDFGANGGTLNASRL